jgi:hypothetical protein
MIQNNSTMDKVIELKARDIKLYQEFVGLLHIA